MKKMLVFVLMFLLAIPTAALAQKRTLPMPYFKHAVSKAELIQACRDNDKSVMNVTCEEYRQDLNWALERMDVKLELKDVEQLLEYLGNLSVEKLPTTKQIVMGRVMPDRTRELGAFSRTPTDGEMGLYDGTNGVYVLSLSCGNMFGTRISVFLSKNPNEAGKPKIDKAAIARAAGEQAKQDAGSNHHNFLSLHRTSGKIIWYGVVPAAAAVVAVACLTPRDDGAGGKVRGCFVNIATATATINKGGGN